MPSSLTARAPVRSSPSRVVLALILAAQLMAVVDVSIVITALPKIHAALNFSSTGLSWVQNAYTLTFGGLLLLGARVGDLLGRRRVFMAGVAVFTLASLLGGLAQSPEWLLAARAVQGAAAAIAVPSTLALLMMSFPEGTERTRAVALYSAVTGAGASVGLVLGGLLTDWISWRWGLFVNVPVGAMVLLLAPRYLAETERRAGRFDLAGAASSTLGMTALVYGFVRAAADGWSTPETIASFVVGVAMLAAFVQIERRAPQPIMPLRLFASLERSGAYVGRLLIVGGMFAFFFYLTQYLQEVRDYSPLKAGLAFVPMTAVLFAMVQVVPKLVPRIGTARLLAAGVLVALVAMAWLSRISPGTQYFPQIALPLVLLGIGMGIAFIPLTSRGIAGVEAADSGAASGLVNVSHQVGGSLGLAILVTVFATASRGAAHHTLAGASAGSQASQVLAHGVAAALTGSTVFLALALVVVIAMVPRRTRATAASEAERQPEADPEAQAAA
ncbi:MAG TPA: MFS transporter [Acidimicrobiales bacterium]|jgi:EmrB/QacA subfamily drug resistance transporter